MSSIASAAQTTEPSPRQSDRRAKRPIWPKPIWALIVGARFLMGYATFLRTAKTPSNAYTDMRRLFRLTNGRSNDVSAFLSRLCHPPYHLPNRAGILGDLSESQVANVAEVLRRRGVYVFKTRLPAEICDRLIQFAQHCPAMPIPRPPSGETSVRYDRQHWIASKYLLQGQQLLENPDMQRIVSDFSILAVAQAYLRCRPVLSSSLMWWSTAFSAEASTEAAQLFHFDMSQIKFLKFFIYLTGVSQTNGPHSYVVGSHRRLPRELREDRRYRDEDVLRHYTAQRITTITGPRGLIFAADTRGLHKGAPLHSGDRLILQLQFSNSSFGDDPPHIMINDRFSPDLLERIEQLPRTYCMFSKPSSKAASPLDQP